MDMKELPINKIVPNPLQPREIFDKEKLKELAATIADVGILQPILVRPKDGRYEIIAGERRWKATQIAGLKTIPALIKELPDSQVMVESLIENVHRSNLKPMEQSKAILEVFKASKASGARRLINDDLPQKISSIDKKQRGEYANNTLTEEETILGSIIGNIGLSADSIYRSLKLLSLPEAIQIKATEKGIDRKHLISIATIETEEDQQEVFDVVVEKELSSRETLALTKVVKKAPEPVKRAVLDATVPVEVAQTIIDTKMVDKDQESILKITVDKKLSKESTEQLVDVVKTSPEPVKKALLDSDLDIETAKKITVAFKDLPEDATEQVTKEVVELIKKDRTESYVIDHIKARQWGAERTDDPAYKEQVEYNPSKHERFANGIIKRCEVINDIFPSLILQMPKIHQDRSIAAIMEAHRILELNIQFLRSKGLLTDDDIDTHRAECALQLTEGISIPKEGEEEIEFVDVEYNEV